MEELSIDETESQLSNSNKNWSRSSISSTVQTEKEFEKLQVNKSESEASNFNKFIPSLSDYFTTQTKLVPYNDSSSIDEDDE